MKILPLERVQLSETSQARLQDNIFNFSVQLTDNPMLKGRYLTVTNSSGEETTLIPLTTTATKFAHKLGKAPLGYLVTFQDGSAIIYSSTLPTASSTEKDFITFRSSANVNANIWVF